MSNSSTSKQKTPAPVARQLRQEAGFGCCECGSPILQYHHIVQWAEEEHFRPENMMVLCPNHHDRASKGAMPISEQRALKKAPVNIRRGFASGLLAVRQDYCAADLGTVTVVNDGPVLVINDEAVFGLSVEDGNLQISATLYDRAGNLIAHIYKNEWLSGDPLPWDVEACWQKLTLRERHGKINLNIDARQIPARLRAEFWKDGKFWSVAKDGIRGSSLGGLHNLALVGLALRLDSTGFLMGPTHDEGCIISWPNHRERLWKAKDAWRKILRAREAKNIVLSQEPSRSFPQPEL